jgi:hypothetical protein
VKGPAKDLVQDVLGLLVGADGFHDGGGRGRGDRVHRVRDGGLHRLGEVGRGVAEGLMRVDRLRVGLPESLDNVSLHVAERRNDERFAERPEANLDVLDVGLMAVALREVLVAAAYWATGTYDPITEAVVLESIDDVIRVLVVREDDAEEVGGIEFTATPTH